MTGTPANIARSMAGNPAGVPGDLDEQVRLPGASVQGSRGGNCPRGVVREEGRDLQRDPTVDSVRSLEGRVKQLGGANQIVERQRKKDILIGLRRRAARNIRIIGRTFPDCLIEDRRVGGQPGHGKFIDVAFQHPVVQHVAGDVVEPKTLPQIVESACRIHRAVSETYICRRRRKSPLQKFVALPPPLRVRQNFPLSRTCPFWALDCRKPNAMVYAFPTRFLDKVEREVNHLATP